MATLGMPIQFCLTSESIFPALVTSVDGSGNPTACFYLSPGSTPVVQGGSLSGGRDDAQSISNSWAPVKFTADVSME
jgi:hypothetical protein